MENGGKWDGPIFQNVYKFVLLYISIVFRGVAQLVERVVWDHEVARSIRVTPTIKKQAFLCLLFCFFKHSAGHWPAHKFNNQINKYLLHLRHLLIGMHN